MERGKYMYFAHSENDLKKMHELRDHLLQTAEIAQSFAPSDDLRPLFFLAGILHDVGKFQDGFQQYLREGRPRTLHAGVGAAVASTFGSQYLPLQFVVQGHHAGMPDNQHRKDTINEYSTESELLKTLLNRFKAQFPEVSMIEDVTPSRYKKEPLLMECVTRFLFSALTDADWLDTESHFSPDRSSARASHTIDSDLLLRQMENEFARLKSDGPVNAMRTAARTAAAVCATSPTGFFSLQLPTGLGKTLISIYWALLHARHNHLKRIIIVLPYLNIIDQTAATLKAIFGENAVLEHHSGIVEGNDAYRNEEPGSDHNSAMALASENWDAPLIITTSVQFFESVFSNRPFKCRKNHNIAGSVVIFDEVQTLPKELSEPTIVMLKNIVQIAHTSFLFCTATQPAFAEREGFDGIDFIRPLIDDPETYFNATRRVAYRFLAKLAPITIDELIQNLSKEKGSFLAILNTKKAAREVFGRISDLGQFPLKYHLSTTMCPHHRKTVIKKISDGIGSGKPIAVVSTQLVEAGVDLDFPCVYRAAAPLDAVIQSAGRCNRNGTMKKKGRVVLFNLENQGWPDRLYKTCTQFTMDRIKQHPDDLHRANSFEQYYAQVTNLYLEPDRFDISDARRSFKFQSVAEKYRIISNATVPLIIAGYSPESETLLVELKESMEKPGNALATRSLTRRIQQYCVPVYRRFLEENNIEPYQDALYIWYGHYDKNIGLSPAEIETVF